MRRAHEIDYQIYGDDMQFVEIGLDPGETIVAEAGAMLFMDSAIASDSTLGDGSGRDAGKGLMDKVIGAGKRALAGEGLFMSTFTNQGSDKKAVSFAAPYPGKIVPVDLTDCQGQLLCQRDAFLCAAKGVAIEIAFQKNVGAGFFGGEGFIMQRLVGDGLTFLHAGGSIIKKELQAGETVKLDTGCLVAMTSSVNYDVAFAGNLKSALFGGEGLFLATLQGPGTVWLQSLPFSKFAGRIVAAGRKSAGSSGKRENVSLGGLGKLLGGD
ncbi:MAG: TIGR00266 family protein [Syntrophomonadaceae bacterium]|nr:TIGR00266 family protein [Syntrophomonadaceae bacterium]